ncbi:MAG: hypothetical protein ACJ787_05485 [Myxococcales bacterium]
MVAVGFTTGSLDTSGSDLVALAIGALLFVGLLVYARRSRG